MRTVTVNVLETKSELLQACYDTAVLGPDRLPPQEQPFFAEIIAAHSGRAALAAFARRNGAIVARVAAIDEVARAAQHEPEVVAVRANSERLRRLGYRSIIDHVDERFGLRPGLAPDRATDVLLTMGSGAPYLMLRVRLEPRGVRRLARRRTGAPAAGAAGPVAPFPGVRPDTALGCDPAGGPPRSWGGTMRRGALVTLCLLASVLLAPGTRPASATPAGFSVSGDGVGTYPAFDPGILRYAVTTTADTGGSVTVTVPSGSSVDGVPASGPVTVTDLSEGDEVAVGVGGSSYALVYLPPDFPALAVTTPRDLQAQLAPGYVGLGLTTFGAGPSFDTIIDRNGVPIWLRRGATSDLKRQPDGDLTVFRPTSDPDHSGSDLVTLNDQFQEIARQRMANGLPDTDNHDAVELADGSTILIGYEPRGEPTTGHLDAIIQKIDRPGHVLFQWSSQGLETESLNPLPWPPLGSEQRIDYAHINSVQEIGDGTHDLLVSFRHFSAVYRIATQDRTGVTAGDIIWRLGGRHSDFAFVDDPDNGPCAQHTANMLLDQPDGHDHVLVFDNGSGPNGQSVPGCVDPGAPLGPGISRQHTRIAEWSLDTGVTPHTATLVWSYQPKIYDPGERDPFSFFAGSARRLDNGDTLIGWADERAMLASEVGADKSLLWQVQTPPTDTPHATRYATYRASLIPYTDAIDPTVTISVADRATYRAGALPVLHWSCTDRGGSNLAGCSTSGLANGQLVPTPGTHTFSITGTDGAGNHRTVVRSYRVIAADGLMRREGGAWVGGNIYGSTSVQTIRQRVARRHTATSHWRVQNDAAHAGVFALAGVGSTHRFRVRYFADGVDVTRAVVAGTFRTPTLAPGAWTSVRVAVTPTRHARPGRTRTIRLHASSPDGAGVDSVAAVVTVRR